MRSELHRQKNGHQIVKKPWENIIGPSEISRSGSVKDNIFELTPTDKQTQPQNICTRYFQWHIQERLNFHQIVLKS